MGAELAKSRPYYRIAADLHTLIQEVVLAPGAPPSVAEAVNQLLPSNGPCFPVHHSALDAEPTW
jgi:hypothetical protein